MDYRWVFNKNVPADQAGKHNLYDPAKSTTHLAKSGQAFTISYGDDTSLGGGVASDTVQIGGIAVPNQLIELPNSVSPGLTSDRSDGISGLGFQSINSITEGGSAAPQPTWFENALSRLSAPLFTVNLRTGTTGKYNFGAIDHTAFDDGALKYVPCDNSTGYWGFDSKQFAVGSGATQTNSKANLAIADTGSSLFYVDPTVLNAYYANVDGKQTDPETKMTIYPCSETLPDFHVSIGTEMAIIPGKLLNWKPDEDTKGPNGEQSRLPCQFAVLNLSLVYNRFQ